MARISPDCSHMMIAKGTIVGGGGVDSQNCSLSVIFTVDNQKDFFKKQVRYGGNHTPHTAGQSL